MGHDSSWHTLEINCRQDRLSFPCHHNATLHKQNKNASLTTYLLHCYVSWQVTTQFQSQAGQISSNWAGEIYFLVGVIPLFPASWCDQITAVASKQHKKHTFSWHLKSLPANLTSHSLPTCKFDMELVLWLENLDVQGAIWSEVFHRPGSEDGLMILRKLETERDWDGWSEVEWTRGRNPSLTASDCSSSLIILLNRWLHRAIERPSQHFSVMQFWHLSSEK